MELFIVARFHARKGQEAALDGEMRDVMGPTREEPGCIEIQQHRAIRDPGLFFITSRWTDESAFDRHAGLPHTVRFIERVSALIDHDLDITRARRLR